MNTLRELTALMESLGRAKSFSEAADRLTSWARQFAGCQAALLRLWEGQDGNVWLAGCASEGHAAAFVRDETVVGHSDCLCGRVASGQIDPSLPFFTHGGSFCWGHFGTLTQDFGDETVGALRGRCLDENYESVAIFPLRMDERIIGSLHLADPRPNHFQDSVEIIEAACRMVGPLLLSHLDRHREHAILEAIQAALMPAQPPAVAGVEIGVSFGSATELARLGGDFYDVLDLGAPGVLILAGDVAGKGVEAAGIAARARYVIDAQAGLDPRPVVFMERANRALALSLPPGRFVTVAACLVQPTTGKVTTCLAGHPAPLLLAASPSMATDPPESSGREVEAPHNPPLGVFAEREFASAEEYLQPGQVLLIYTDGVSESRRGSEVFGLNRIIEAARATPSQDPEQIARSVHKSALAFHDPALPDDDRLVIAVRLQGVPFGSRRGSR